MSDTNWVGWDPGWVPEIRGDWGDWQDVMPRRQKGLRQEDRDQDGQRWSSRQKGRYLAETDLELVHHRSKVQVEDDVAGARKGNVYDKKYGFVRYSKVRDVTKLLRAINDISLGQFRIWARVARFDKAYDGGEDNGLRENGGGDVGIDHDDHDLSHHVDMLVEKLAYNLVRVEGLEDVDELMGNRRLLIASLHSLQREVSVPKHHISDTENVLLLTSPENEVLHNTHELPMIYPLEGTAEQPKQSGPILSRRKRHLLCPPCGGHPVLSGPSSIEWLNDHNHCDAGIIFSPKKTLQNKIFHLGYLGESQRGSQRGQARVLLWLQLIRTRNIGWCCMGMRR
ncbi:hypothetical protein L195_g040012, partial [Trifolium pratense]